MNTVEYNSVNKWNSMKDVNILIIHREYKYQRKSGVYLGHFSVNLHMKENFRQKDYSGEIYL